MVCVCSAVSGAISETLPQRYYLTHAF